MRTQLQSQPLQAKVFELAAANRNPIRLQVSSVSDSSLGHQFMFIGIPFGSVESQQLDVMLKRATYQKLALKGFTPVINSSDKVLPNMFGAGAPELSLVVHGASATAYDLLVTRWLRCSLQLSAQLSNATGSSEVRSEGTFQHLGAFAFERELSLCFARALDTALDNVLGDLAI